MASQKARPSAAGADSLPLPLLSLGLQLTCSHKMRDTGSPVVDMSMDEAPTRSDGVSKPSGSNTPASCNAVARCDSQSRPGIFGTVGSVGVHVMSCCRFQQSKAEALHPAQRSHPKT